MVSSQGSLLIYRSLAIRLRDLPPLPSGRVRSGVSFIIIIKKDWECKAGRGRLTPYQSEDPSPTLPTYRGKEEKGKIVEDKKGESI